MCHICCFQPEFNLQKSQNINIEWWFHASSLSSSLWGRQQLSHNPASSSTVHKLLFFLLHMKLCSVGHIPLLFCRGFEGLLPCLLDLFPQSWIQRYLRLKCCHCRPMEEIAVIFWRLIKNTVFRMWRRTAVDKILTKRLKPFSIWHLNKKNKKKTFRTFNKSRHSQF